jgi:hypothetical protein
MTNYNIIIIIKMTIYAEGSENFDITIKSGSFLNFFGGEFRFQFAPQLHP